MELIILIGLSGAGKTTSLNTLEDLGFHTIWNIPLKFSIETIKDLKKENMKKIAMCLDLSLVPNEESIDYFLDRIDEMNISYQLIFIEASVQAIVNRFNLTRRKHPINSKTLLESIENEIKIMKEVKSRADITIDTTFLTAEDLVSEIKKINSKLTTTNQLSVHLQSFGYKYGIPIDADLIFDVRILKNPYYEKELKNKSGLDADVYNFVMNSAFSEELYLKILDIITFTIERYITTQKKYLTICIGCTGGQHRSVSFVERIKKDIMKNIMGKEINLFIIHRENLKGNW